VSLEIQLRIAKNELKEKKLECMQLQQFLHAELTLMMTIVFDISQLTYFIKPWRLP
jgi:hypothetical protein